MSSIKTGFSPLAILIILFTACSNQPEKIPCSRFKTGEFFIKPKNGISSFTLLRDDSTQYETEEKTGKTSTYKVNWTGDCEYQLLFTGDNIKRSTGEAGGSTFTDSLRKVPINVQIVSTAKNYYVFRIKRERIDFIYTDTIWVSK
jgi:hypothetical protein